MVICGVMNGSYAMMAKPMKTLELLYSITMVSMRVVFLGGGEVGGDGGGYVCFLSVFSFILEVFLIKQLFHSRFLDIR